MSEKVIPPSVQCQSCGKPFIPRLGFQTVVQGASTSYFCSVPCRAMPAGAGAEAVCDTCGTRFVPTYAYQVTRKGDAKVYACSDACRQSQRPDVPAAVHRAPARVFAVLNQKGGTGKTTTSINVAAGLAERHRRVLLVDADPQGNVAASLGVRSKKSLYDVLMNGAAIADAVVPLFENLDVLTSDERLAAAEIKLAQRPKRAGLLKRHIDSVASQYDDILIDCGPSLSLLNQNVLCASTSVLVVVACDYLSLVGVKQVLRTIKNVGAHLGHPISVGAVVPTMYDARARICRDALDSLQKHFGDKCLPPVRHNVRLKEAPSKKKTIFEHAPGSHGAEDYLAVVDALCAPVTEEVHVASLVRSGAR